MGASTLSHQRVGKRATMNNLTEEDLRAIWAQISEPQESFYRLYHGEQGEPLFYSMEDSPGNYIEIDRETFVRSATNVRVVDGKLITIKTATVHKLVPGNIGTPCCPGDVAVVVSETDPNIKWMLK